MKIEDMLTRLATLGPVGFSPVAPGTMGTLAAVLLVWAVPMPAPIYIALTLLITALGTIASEKAEEVLGEKDPGCIIIDEVAGYMVAMALLPVTAGYLIASFALFRAFDILKPPPINRLQGIRGGPGVMVDDIVAGLLANAILQLWRLMS